MNKELAAQLGKHVKPDRATAGSAASGDAEGMLQSELNGAR